MRGAAGLPAKRSAGFGHVVFFARYQWLWDVFVI